MQNFTPKEEKMDKTMGNHCNSVGMLCHLEEPALENREGSVFVEVTIPPFPKFLWCF